MPAENENGLINFLGSLIHNTAFYISICILPLWKFIDKYFDYLKGKDRDFIKSVVKEGMTENMRELREDINEIRKAQDRDRENFNRQLMEVLRDRRQ